MEPDLAISRLSIYILTGLMASAFVYASGGLGSSPGRGHCVVFLGKTRYSHSASLHPGI